MTARTPLPRQAEGLSADAASPSKLRNEMQELEYAISDIQGLCAALRDVLGDNMRHAASASITAIEMFAEKAQAHFQTCWTEMLVLEKEGRT